MNSPHGSSRIMALSFLKETEDSISSTLLSSSSSSHHEDRHVMCATSSDDGTVKVWMASKQTFTAINSSAITLSKNTTTTSTSATAASSSSTSHDHNTDALQWTCSYSFQYRNITANSLSFSKDGSSMAVSHGGLLTLWDPTRYRLVFELICYIIPPSTCLLDCNSLSVHVF